MFYNPFVLDGELGAALVRIAHDVITASNVNVFPGQCECLNVSA